MKDPINYIVTHLPSLVKVQMTDGHAGYMLSLDCQEKGINLIYKYEQAYSKGKGLINKYRYDYNLKNFNQHSADFIYLYQEIETQDELIEQIKYLQNWLFDNGLSQNQIKN